MKLTKKLGMLLALSCSTVSMAQANDLELVAGQYFYGYEDQFNNGTWGIIDDLDFSELQEENPNSLKRELKALYSEDGKMYFDVQWTRKTLKKMFPAEWENVKSLDGDERRAAIKQLRNQACDARMEVGYATTYGIDGEGYAAELDTHACNNEQKLGTVRMRTYVPTVPGAEYAISVKYQKRDYDYERLGARNEAQAFRDLIVRVGSEKHKLSIDAVEGESLDQGFKKAWITFTADRFYTPLILRDSGFPDSYGILIRGVQAFKTADNERELECSAYYAAHTRALKRCLVGDVDPQSIGCDLTAANIEWIQGEKVSTNPDRSTVSNVFSTANDKFLTLGQAGKLKLTMRQNGINAACPIAGKTLKFNEFTANDQTYLTYAEKGVIGIKLIGCEDESQNGRTLLANQHYSADPENPYEVQTSDIFEYNFAPEFYQGCRLSKVVITDRTDQIPETQEGYISYSLGIEVNSLNLTTED
ncbi:hypothetical protein LMH66_14170 [Shewanella sp. 10N.7]|uniref:hypothetical protein n=1 Tax=Shewanella sp. 10N.7 TaxID=2885093 RepID=UPI001E45105A|nr:hypothetical protein [Shewanella sp. 10N.7]MCC4833785.1 hypothetical protein [Shewanella sp. 10N.7]